MGPNLSVQIMQVFPFYSVLTNMQVPLYIVSSGLSWLGRWFESQYIFCLNTCVPQTYVFIVQWIQTSVIWTPQTSNVTVLLECFVDSVHSIRVNDSSIKAIE